jgi:predicted ATP-dependent serine protease
MPESTDEDAGGLKRTLGAGDLVMLAIGAVIGAGIFGAIAAAIASAATGVPPPRGAAFVGEVALTGLVRSASAVAQRLAAARAAGCTVVFAAAANGEPAPGKLDGIRVVPVCHVSEALGWALRPVETHFRPRSA